MTTTDNNHTLLKTSGALKPQLCWEGLKVDYLAGAETVKTIAAKHGVSVARIYQVAKAQNWPKRGSALTRSKTSKPRSGLHEQSPKEMLIRRFYSVLNHQTRELEQRFVEHDGDLPPSTEAERDARTLGSLAKLLEKLIELEQSGAADEKEQVGDKSAPTDMDAFREELARKLDELQQREGS